VGGGGQRFLLGMLVINVGFEPFFRVIRHYFHEAFGEWPHLGQSDAGVTSGMSAKQSHSGAGDPGQEKSPPTWAERSGCVLASLTKGNSTSWTHPRASFGSFFSTRNVMQGATLSQHERPTGSPTDFGRDPRASGVGVVAFALGAMFMGSTLLTPLYGLYRVKFGFSQLTLTLIYASYVVGNLGALLFLGRLSDEIGRRRVCLPAIAGAVLSTLGFIAAPGIGWLFAARTLSGLAIGLVSGTATAWIAELARSSDKARASVVATAANYTGLAAGPLLAGVLAHYAPAPLKTSFVVYLAILGLTAALILRPRETVPRRERGGLPSLRPRIGVPREIRASFVAPALTAFATFAVVGFYAALAPGLLVRDLHQTNLAVNGAVIAELFVAGTAAIFASRNVKSRTAMLGGLSVLLVSLVVLALADALRSFPVLLVGTALVGLASAIGYRGSLQVVNEIAPADRRAEVISSYLVIGFLGNALPVVGVGVLSEVFNPVVADATLAGVVALLAVIALVAGRKFTAPPTATA
jgi:MFS family permease